MNTPKEKKKGKDPMDKLSPWGDLLKDMEEKYAFMETQLNTSNDRITALNARIAIRNEVISGFFEKYFEDCRRKISIYKKSTVEHRVNEMLMDRMVDLRRDILNA